MKKIVLFFILLMSTILLVGANKVHAVPFELIDDGGGGGGSTDTCNSAYAMPTNLGTIKHCAFESSSDIDYVIFETSYSSVYTIDVNIDNMSNLDYVKVYNKSTGSYISPLYSNNGYYVYNLSKNTEYKIKLQGYYDGYTVEVNADDTCNSESLTLGSTRYCAFDGNSNTYDKDIFTFTTSSSYDYYVDIDSSITSNFDNIKIFNSYGSVILDEDNEGIHAINLPSYSSGTIHVTGASSNYDIKVYPRVDDCSDYFGGSAQLTMGVSKTCEVQVKQSGSDSDYFRIVPTQSGVYKLTFRHYTTGSFNNIEIYDSEYNKIEVDIQSEYFYGELIYTAHMFIEEGEIFYTKITGSTHGSSFTVKYDKEMLVSNSSWVNIDTYPQSDILRKFNTTGEEYGFSNVYWELNEFGYEDNFELGYYKYTFWNDLTNKYVTYYYDWIVYEYINPDTPNQINFGVEYLHADVYTYDPISKTVNWQGHAQPTSGDMEDIRISYLSTERISFFNLDDNASANATSKNLTEAVVGYIEDQVYDYFFGDFNSFMSKATDFYNKYMTNGDSFDYETLGFTMYNGFTISNGSYPIGPNTDLYSFHLFYEDNYYMKLNESFVTPQQHYNERTASSKLTITSTDQNPYYHISLKIELDYKTGHDYVVFEIDSEGYQSVTTE